MTPKINPREDLLKIIEKLPLDKIRIMLAIGRSMEFEIEHKQDKYQPNTGTIESLEGLKGIVTLGGDAVEDAEEYWK